MNSDEGLSLAKMAVSVLLVVLVIGAVVAVVYAAYSWFNSGTSKLGDQVTSIDKSAYSQYDDTQVSGTDVLSALKAYRESEIGIFISNKNNGTPYSSTQTTATAMNYCALASGDGTVAANTTSTTTAPKLDASGNYAMTITLTNGQWTIDSISYYDGQQATATAMKNTNFSPTTQTNDAAHYVKQSAKWYANLVYSDETGDVCGILFRQMN